MNSLRETIESSPRLRGLMSEITAGDRQPAPKSLAPARWDWQGVHRVLVIRLRSIGDTVLTTPSLIALRRFLPHARIDILLEERIAPVLEGFAEVAQVITFDSQSLLSRLRVARQLRATGYDVVYNLHGGTTATLLTRATGAKHRVGFKHYQYRRLHNHLAPSPAELWGSFKLHSVEQQLALIGWTGVPVTDRPSTRLAVTADADASVSNKLREAGFDGTRPFAVIHPGASYLTKQWAVDKFARVAEELAGRGVASVVIAAPSEEPIITALSKESQATVTGLATLTLPEITALTARSRLFVGNDSGIAHIAAATGTPSVVIFGSSNVTHWRPWTTQPNEIVREELPCQPCHGYFCAEFEKPECIIRVPVERVTGAIDRVLRDSA